MKLTSEQIAILNSSGNIKINAVAGSGKTTTIIEYAGSRPSDSKILYLAFNKSVKDEAKKKFAERGLKNVKVETAHSLAYGRIVPKYGYTVKSGYKTTEIADILNLRLSGEKHGEFIIANHINKLLMFYCNSNKETLMELNYPETITDKKAKTFVKTHYGYIQQKTLALIDKMEKKKIEITHDYYLKKFQLSNPVLNYDYILFDEGQDASAAMLDIFLKQKAVKVIVGDTNQQIYGWRYAVNSLEKANFQTFHLSTSFRFDQHIADLAIRVLKLKNHLEIKNEVSITGKGSERPILSKAVIARTNLGLLLKAIGYVTEKKKVQQLYFEGNINSYTYADDGTSLYDVLNLYNGKHRLIRDKLIKVMNNLDDLKDYVKKTEDVQMGMMVEIVEKYGNEIPKILDEIKQKHVDNKDREKAEIIFSTVHRSKGMEYDEIQLVNDFLNEETLKKLVDDKPENIDVAKLNEEINLLYVAITRTKNKLYIPETLIPEGYIVGGNILVTKVKKDESKQPEKANYAKSKWDAELSRNAKTNKTNEVQVKYKSSYQPWTKEMDLELAELFYSGANINEIQKHFGRTKGAIQARMRKIIEVEDILLYDSVKSLNEASVPIDKAFKTIARKHKKQNKFIK